MNLTSEVRPLIVALFSILLGATGQFLFGLGNAWIMVK